MAKDKTKGVSAERSESIIDPRRVERVRQPEPAAPAAPATQATQARPATSAKPGQLRPVEDIARDQGLPLWEQAALRQAAGWAPGRQVSAEQFGAALAKLRSRACGSGRI